MQQEEGSTRLDSDEESRGVMLMAFGLGVLTGALLGTLLAPAAGRDTRAAVRRGTAAAAARGRQVMRERREQVHAYIRQHGLIKLLRRHPEVVET